MEKYMSIYAYLWYSNMYWNSFYNTLVAMEVNSFVLISDFDF